MLDIRTLQVLKEAKEYKRLRAHVPDRAFDQRATILLEAYGQFFKEFAGVEVIDYRTFGPWFETRFRPKLSDEERGVFRAIIKNALTNELDPIIKQGLLRQLNDCKLHYDLKVTLAKWEDGTLPDFRYHVGNIYAQAKLALNERLAPVNPNIEGQLDEAQSEAGLRWPLLALDLVCRPLRAGDFIICAARPGKGKTSFMAYLVAHWIKQLPANKNVIWLNNEGKGERIYMRLYQAMLECSILGLIDHRKAGTLHSAYEKAAGRMDKVRVFDIHGMNNGEVTALLEENNPGLIIYDMLGNIHLTDSDSTTRSDLRVEGLAQWAREDCVQFDSVGIATWQISGEGADMLYPPESALMNSKTAAQGACDGIIMLGNLEGNAAMKNIRGLSMPKTKMGRPGTSGDPHCEIQFNQDNSTYSEIDMDGSDPSGVEFEGGL